MTIRERRFLRSLAHATNPVNVPTCSRFSATTFFPRLSAQAPVKLATIDHLVASQAGRSATALFGWLPSDGRATGWLHSEIVNHPDHRGLRESSQIRPCECVVGRRPPQAAAALSAASTRLVKAIDFVPSSVVQSPFITRVTRPFFLMLRRLSSAVLQRLTVDAGLLKSATSVQTCSVGFVDWTSAPEDGMSGRTGIRCHKCGKLGHMAKDCKAPGVNRNMNCYKCEQPGHLARDCPEGGGSDMNNGGGQQGESVCYKCGNPGHFARECPDSQQPRNDMICYSCNQKGHISRECPNRSGVKGEVECYNCKEKGHISRDCPTKESRPPITCYRCQQEGHIARDCSAE